MKEIDNNNLIVMLTYNDKTVENAYEIFNNCKNSNVLYWGFKEEPLSLNEMKKIFYLMKENGKKTVLEVVAYTQEECIIGAKKAIECGCDILMGTIYSEYINELCQKNNIKYMPFVGNVYERPSILDGKIEDMINEANKYIENGVYGIDLLGYRYTGNASKLNKQIVENVKGNVCLAGSINSYERLNEVLENKPYSFTIGSAFFENKFGNAFEEQIEKVYTYTKKKVK